MVLTVISYFLALMLSFFLFYFNVPYWTGRDMADMSKSGIWRAFFRFLSFLGYGLHRIYGTIIGTFMRWFSNTVFKGREEKHRLSLAVVCLIPVLASTGILFLLTSGYGLFIDSFFPAGVSDLAEGGEGLLSKLSQFLVFLRVAASLKPEAAAWSFGTAVAAVVTTLISLVLYVVINTLFFSILYGFLREMLVEVDLSKRLPFLRKQSAPLAAGSGGGALGGLGGRLLAALRDFCNKMTLMGFLRDPFTLALFAVVVLLFSIVMVRLGKNDLTFGGVLKEVLDSIGVVKIVVSFVVTYLVGKCAEKGAKAVVRHLPRGVQRAIHNASIRGNAWADLQDSKRRAWARSNSEAHTAPSPEAPRAPAYDPPHEARPPLNFEDEYHSALAYIIDCARKFDITVTPKDILRVLEGDSEIGNGWRRLETRDEKVEFLLRNTPAIVAELTANL